MYQVAVQGLDLMETYPSEQEQVETAVVATVLDEPVLTSPPRPAQEEESRGATGSEPAGVRASGRQSGQTAGPCDPRNRAMSKGPSPK